MIRYASTPGVAGLQPNQTKTIRGKRELGESETKEQSHSTAARVFTHFISDSSDTNIRNQEIKVLRAGMRGPSRPTSR
jgi:hypothetical protein